MGRSVIEALCTDKVGINSSLISHYSIHPKKVDECVTKALMVTLGKQTLELYR